MCPPRTCCSVGCPGAALHAQRYAPRHREGGMSPWSSRISVFSIVARQPCLDVVGRHRPLAPGNNQDVSTWTDPPRTLGPCVRRRPPTSAPGDPGRHPFSHPANPSPAQAASNCRNCASSWSTGGSSTPATKNARKVLSAPASVNRSRHAQIRARHMRGGLCRSQALDHYCNVAPWTSSTDQRRPRRPPIRVPAENAAAPRGAAGGCVATPRPVPEPVGRVTVPVG